MLMLMYDIIIIGGGPAGLMAALFAKRNGMNVLVLNNPEKLSNLALAHSIENHPGEIKIKGTELLERIKKQVEKSGIEIKNERVVSIDKSEHFMVQCHHGVYESPSVIIATGLVSRKANVEGEDSFLGKGVSYCVLCDGPMFRGKDVLVAGGGDSAVTGAIALKEMGARNVYIIHRRNEFRAEKANVSKLKKAGITQILDSVITEIKGSKFVEAVKIKNTKTEKITELPVSGVFVEIGYMPLSELVKNLGIFVDKNGFIKTNEKNETNIKGVFAAGDITSGGYKLLVIAYAQGSISGLNASKYVNEIKGSEFKPQLY